MNVIRIKRYKLRESVNSHDLVQLGFKEWSWDEKDKCKLVMSKWMPLVSSIELHITIPLEDEFQDYENILILDDEFCQPYAPFYRENYRPKTKNFKLLGSVIERYNQVMNKLGIFEEKQEN